MVLRERKVSVAVRRGGHRYCSVLCLMARHDAKRGGVAQGPTGSSAVTALDRITPLSRLRHLSSISPPLPSAGSRAGKRRKPHAELNPGLVAEAKRLRRCSPKGTRRSLRDVAAELARNGPVTRDLTVQQLPDGHGQLLPASVRAGAGRPCHHCRAANDVRVINILPIRQQEKFLNDRCPEIKVNRGTSWPRWFLS